MFPAWAEAIILGIVQGLTEFIPVSSSGHLVLVPYLLGWEKASLAFDVMLHVGTLGAVLLYFRGELLAIMRGITGLDRSAEGLIYRRVGLYLVPASVPIAIVGLFLADQIESVFSSPLTAAFLLLITAALLLTAEFVRDRRVAGAAPTPVAAPAAVTAGPEETWTGDWRAADAPEGVPLPTAGGLPLGTDPTDPAGTDLAGLTLRQAMIAGLAQCIAVLPGISRAGSTITGAVFAGLTREAATRLSFLLAIPALVGATVLSLPDLADAGESLPELAGGMLAAFLSGYAAVRYLVRLVARERLTGFAYYCLGASAVGLIGYLMLGPPSTV